MRTLVIGDIHGCLRAFQTLLDTLKPGPEDILITLGDYVDRGPDSCGVLDKLIELDKQTQLRPLIGNHEILFLECYHERLDPTGWLRVGGAETLGSYAQPGQDPLSFARVKEAHITFISQRCLRYFEDESHLYVHANANAYYSLRDQSDDWIFWTRFDDAHPHISGKKLICGHTAQRSGLPAIKPYAICLDTWAYGEGWLTCLDVEKGQIWQAKQNGEKRSLFLDDLETLASAKTQQITLPQLSRED